MLKKGYIKPKGIYIYILCKLLKISPHNASAINALC